MYEAQSIIVYLDDFYASISPSKRADNALVIFVLFMIWAVVDGVISIAWVAPHVALDSSAHDDLVHDLEDVVSPYDVQDQQGWQQDIKDVVGREHLDQLGRFDGCAVKDVSRVDSESCQNPGEGKADEQEVAGLLEVCVLAHLAGFEENVSTVVNCKDQSSDPGQVASPRERHQRNGSHVMDEHLPEVLSLDVEELADAERPVEA